MLQDIAPHQLENEYDPQAQPAADSPVYVFEDGRLWVAKEDDRNGLRLPRRSDLSETAECVYAFALDDVPHFIVLSKGEQPAGFQTVSVRDLRMAGEEKKEDIFAAWTAFQLSNWYRDNHFCGRCSAVTAPSERERSLVCPDCGRVIYPRILPAVIVGVTNGDEIILTRYNRPGAYHALVAGFVEIGETLEDTVRREVMEEVGLKVKNIRYYKSQPWAVVDDLLCGFYCDVDGDPTITLDRNELKEAAWVRREDVDSQPNHFSLTNEMMQTFKRGEEPKA